MDVIREIIDADQLLGVMDLPEAMKHHRVEVTVSTVPEKKEQPRLTRQMIDRMLPGSITQSLLGVLPSS
ncbi:hypothetical protein FACS189468_6280 [Spirochaetia bacterium]|nr:hypothetical protein FACS189468_6280 [Spirochaetia bacterium]